MIRFVDLTDAYWACDAENAHELPCCAFLDTVTDRFVKAGDCHTFDYDADLDMIEDEGLRERCRALVPKRFWTAPREDVGYCHACGAGGAVYCAECSDACLQAKLVEIDAALVKERSGEWGESRAIVAIRRARQ